MKKTICGVALALGLLAVPPFAQGATVAKVLTFSGTLRTSSGAVETAYKDIEFRLYAVPDGGTALFTETIGVQPATDGTFSVKIGSTTPLDGALFAQQLYLGIRVATEAEMVPRTQLTPTPYTWAVDWSSVTGFPSPCPAGQFVTGLGPTLTCSIPPQAVAAVQGSGVIVATTSGGTATVSLATTGCVVGQVLKYGALGWGCEDDTDTGLLAVSRNATLVGDGTAGAPLGLATCANGQILKMGSTTWGCAADVDTGLTSVAVASPLTGNGSTTPVGLMTCTTAGHVLKWSGSAWECQPDVDTDTTGLTAVTRDTSLVGDGTPGSPLGVSYLLADLTGKEGAATTAARSDHRHAASEHLGAPPYVQGSVSFDSISIAGVQVGGTNLNPGSSAVWSWQLDPGAGGVPTTVHVAFTSVYLDNGGIAVAPPFTFEAKLIRPGELLPCTLPAPAPFYNPTGNPPYAAGMSVLVKVSFSDFTTCSLTDDATLVIRVTNPASATVPAAIIEGLIKFIY